MKLNKIRKFMKENGEPLLVTLSVGIISIIMAIGIVAIIYSVIGI